MNKAYAALLALPLLAAPAAAQQCGRSGVLSFGGGADITLKGHYAAACGPACVPGCGPSGTQLAPWYLYWPQEAYFQAPAPTGYPYWPAPQSLPNGNASVPAAVVPSYYLQPTSYAGGPPSYWYGR